MNTPEYKTYKRLAFFLIIIGLLFAFDSLLHLSFIYKLWPLILTILGAGFIGIYVKRKQRGILFLAVGEYILCFSVLALYCNFTSWRNMSDLWPLFIGFLGIALVTVFFLDRNRRNLLFIGLLLASLSIYFLLVFSLGSQFWWIIFIFAGLCILLSGGLK